MLELLIVYCRCCQFKSINAFSEETIIVPMILLIIKELA